jgi:predicted DNA binding CopG/RHH family protein
MKNKIIYTDEPLHFGEIVEDFLPPPEKLILKKKTVTVELELTEEIVNFLEKQANKQKITYQNIIESLVKNYVDQ